MSRIISFAWTSPALLAGAKTVTRRDWKPAYAASFRKGDLVTAYDRSQRAGGRPIAELRLIDDVHLEEDAAAPDSDYEGEGFAWFAEHPERLPKRARDEYRVTTSRWAFDRWRRDGGRSYVIRFEMVRAL